MSALHRCGKQRARACLRVKKAWRVGRRGVLRRWILREKLVCLMLDGAVLAARRPWVRVLHYGL